METSANLHFEWDGDSKKAFNELEFQLFVNGNLCVSDWNYADGFELDIPISGSKLAIEVKTGKKGGDKFRSFFKHEFDVEPGANYDAELTEEASSFMGLKFKLSKPNGGVTDNTPACYKNLPVILMSFCFPIYGVYNAIRSSYNRIAAIVGGALGFLLGVIFSSVADADYSTISFGIGRLSIVEYEPFSFLDWVINLLIGGISTLRGFLYLLS